MGREGEVVAELLPEFERTHPGIRVDVQQLPVDRRARKAADRVRRRRDARRLPARQHLDPGVRGAECARAARRPRRRVGRRSIRATTSPASGTPTSSTARCYGVPWYVDTRLLFYRRDLLARAGFAAPPRSWDEWTRMLAAVKARRRARSLRDPAAAERVRAAARARAAAGRPAAARRRPLGQLPQRGLSPRAALLRRHVPAGLRAAADQRRQSPTCGTSSAAATSRSTSRARGTSASSSAACRADRQDELDDGAAARPDGPGRVDRRRLEPRRVPRVAPQGRGVAADRVPVAARRAAALPRADRRPAAAAQRVGRRQPCRRRLRARVSRPARARQAGAEGAGVGAHRDRDPHRGRAARARRARRSTRRPRSSTRAPTGSSKSAAGCSRGTARS